MILLSLNHMILSLFTIFSFAAIFVSGINHDSLGLSLTVSLLSIIFGLFYLTKLGAKLKVPRHFQLVSIFVLILHIYLFFTPHKLNPFYYTAIFSLGLFYWVIFYNLKSRLIIFKSLLIILIILYSLIYFFSIIFNLNLTSLGELIFSRGFPNRHFFVGPLAAFSIIGIIAWHWKKLKVSHWLFIILGVSLLYISNTRAAYFSFVLGLAYIWIKKGINTKKQKAIAVLVIILISGLVMLSSRYKTIFFSRPYFLHSIQAFPKHPLGVGLGNFEMISLEIQQKQATNDGVFSIYTHNILLEAISGIGIFSLPFVAFFILIIRDLIKAKSNILSGAIVVAIMSNFLVDTSYTVPGFVWLFFISLGIYQSEEKLLSS